MTDWTSADTDVERACTARIDDAILGGGSNLGVDRVAAHHLLAAVPEYQGFVQDNRRFVRSAVKMMVAAGIYQFLDLGAGMASIGGVHDLVPRPIPDIRIAYVETDPVCVAHLEAISRNNKRVSVHPTDLFAPSWVLDKEAVWRELDPHRPVGIFMTSVLHYQLSDEVVATTLRRYHDGVAPGSMLALTHLTSDQDSTRLNQLETVHAELGFPIRTRDSASLSALSTPWTPLNLAAAADVHQPRLGAACLLVRLAAPPH